jgi:hypothetical protein
VLLMCIIVEQTTPKIAMESPTESTLRRLSVPGSEQNMSKRSSERQTSAFGPQLPVPLVFARSHHLNCSDKLLGFR